jgi:hypothetical protein
MSDNQKACDVCWTTVDNAHTLTSAGYLSVGRYLSPDTTLHPCKRLTQPEAQGLHSVNIKIFLIWEVDDTLASLQGNGSAHGTAAAQVAAGLGVPANDTVCIYSSFDWDVQASELDGCAQYQSDFRQAVEAAGYLPSAYGSGTLLEHLSSPGVIHNCGFLAESTGFGGYDDWKDKATILQSETTDTPGGLDIDADIIQDIASAGLW